jgi:ABC-type lipoprotein export system ATPase subunit
MPPATPNDFDGPRAEPRMTSPPTLLSFSNVTKRYPDGGRERVVLKAISFDLAEGAVVGLYGAPGFGKSTLLRLAAAIESPDEGSIHFDGEDITRRTGTERARLLRSPIALLADGGWLAGPGESVLDHVAMSIGAQGLTMRECKRRALDTLDAVGVSATGAAESAAALSAEKRARAMLARALVREPRLLLVDEPAPMPSIEGHDRFCALLRGITAERGIALLVASESLAPGGVAAQMWLSADGELSTTEEQGTVVELRPHRAAASGPS